MTGKKQGQTTFLIPPGRAARDGKRGLSLNLGVAA